MHKISITMWNWQQKNWTHFSYKENAFENINEQFIYNLGHFRGALKHLTQNDQSTLIVDLMTDEAFKTSEIEGDYLNRDSIHSSIRRNFGLQADHYKISPAEYGISEMLVNLYESFAAPLTHDMLYKWHKMLTNGRRDLSDIGAYRTHIEPMQIISGSLPPKIYFEAPPSHIVHHEMNHFLEWFNQTAPNGTSPLPALIRAGIAHLYFVTIHPFEDGNGRIGRAIVEKSLSQQAGNPTLFALSTIIQKNKKKYYIALEKSNKTNEITDWLLYFSQTILEAQRYTQELIEFIINKTKIMNRLTGKINDRQEKALIRMFKEGPSGFKGGLNAKKYISITHVSTATATRDLQDLVDKGALHREGVLKGARYYLITDSQ